MGRNKYGPEVIKAGAFPRALKESQCRGMTEMGTVEPKPSGQGHTLSPTDIRKRRAARAQRSTKGMAPRVRSVPFTGRVRVSSRRLSLTPGSVGAVAGSGPVWLPPRNPRKKRG